MTKYRLARVGIGDEAAVKRPLFALEAHVEVDGAAAGDFMGHVFEGLTAPTLDFLTHVVEGVQDERVEVSLTAHDETALGAIHRDAVVLVKVAAIGEEQIAGEILGRGQELPLGIAVGAQHDAVHRFGQEIHIHVQLHRGRADGGEATGKLFGQCVFQCERGAVLETNMPEPCERALRSKAQHINDQLIHQAGEQPPHEGRKLALGELIMKGLVLHALVTQRVEGSLNVGNRLDIPAPKGLDHAHGEAMGRHTALTMAKPSASAKLVQFGFRKRTLELITHGMHVDVLHSIVPQ